MTEITFKRQKTVSGKLPLVYLEGVWGLGVKFRKYSEQNAPFDAWLRRRLQNNSSEVVASFKTTREIMPHPVAHAHKLLPALRRRRPLESHRFVSSLMTQELAGRCCHFFFALRYLKKDWA